MNRNKKTNAVLISILSFCMVFAGCSSAGKEAVTTISQTSNGGAAADPFGKYNPPIAVTAARYIDNVASKYIDGESITNNVWSRLYSEYGINLKYDWTTTGGIDQYDQKLNISIASGNLPEFFSVNAIQLKQLADAGQLADLTKLFEESASKDLKGILEQDPSYLKSATFNGQLLALPSTQAVVTTGTPVLFIRNDWMKKLNLPEPKSMADLLAIAEAFVKDDPDGDKKADTYGLEIDKGGAPGGFMNSYHAYPDIWVKDQSGKLVYGSIQPEVKQALGKLQEMYKNGLLDKEFGVKDFNKMIESVNANKIGILYGASWIPYVVAPMVENDPSVEWKAFPLLSVDDQQAKPSLPFATGTYYVAAKGAKHPEALIKIMNLFYEKMYGETADSAKYLNDGNREVWHYAFTSMFNPLKDLIGYEKIDKAAKSNDPSDLNTEEKLFYDKYMAYQKGDMKQWVYDAVYKEGGPTSVLDDLQKKNAFVQNEFYGAPTKSQSEKGAVLSKLESETFTKIIMGDPLDIFDAFVSNWKNLGGDAWTKEVNDWYKSQK